ncbi:hypothetical protein [Phenylobacterium sp.]|jgi:hypothetical protein|uniref:hypothetical protein n=1 Tax=Phenylobacterium sp. TaxID=1871053 RepID=UPI002F3F89BE
MIPLILAAAIAACTPNVSTPTPLGWISTVDAGHTDAGPWRPADPLLFTTLRPSNFTFSNGGKTVLSFTQDGKVIPGDGLSNDQATRELFDVMVKHWPFLIDAWAKAQGWTPPVEGREP